MRRRPALAEFARSNLPPALAWEAQTNGGAAAAVAAHEFWYHTIDVAPGVTTPGWFDLRPVVDHMPWPDLTGKRCLEVGPYDGFLSFEMERRGAAEVVAADIGSPWEWDWPVRSRESGPRGSSLLAGDRPLADVPEWSGDGGVYVRAAESLGPGIVLRALVHRKHRQVLGDQLLRLL